MPIVSRAGREAAGEAGRRAADDELVAALTLGLRQSAELAGLQRSTIVKLARRLNDDERLDFDQAVKELEHAVETALEVIRSGERGSNDDEFVTRVLARVAELIRRDDLDGGAAEVDIALADLDAGYRRSKVTLLEEGIRVDTLRRDAAAVARRIEEIIGVEHPGDHLGERIAWRPEFRERFDAFMTEGDEKGLNFSLSVAIALARRMLDSARGADERGTALNLLGNALWTPRRARERHGAAGGGGRRLSRGAGGMDARARAARLGDDAEQSRHRALERSASARAARRGWRRRSPPIARRWRNGPASACRSTGR